jgi:hypothetical protein
MRPEVELEGDAESVGLGAAAESVGLGAAEESVGEDAGLSAGRGESDGAGDGASDGAGEGDSDGAGDGESVGDCESVGDGVEESVDEDDVLLESANAVTAPAGPATIEAAMQTTRMNALAVFRIGPSPLALVPVNQAEPLSLLRPVRARAE